MVVESPAGATVKFKYDPDNKIFVVSRFLVYGLRYPFHWGFIPRTLEPDGDPLDVMLLCREPAFPGIVFECRPLGIIHLEEKKKKSDGRERNDRVIAIPLSNERTTLKRPGDLSARQKEELEQFFLSAVFFEEKEAKIKGWSGPNEAEERIKESARAYSKKSK